jgi:regulator of protease activity HflC (stomatin/prohibitin superfamily)
MSDSRGSSRRPRLKTVGCAAGAIVLAGFLWKAWDYSRTEWIPAGSVGILYDASGGLQKDVIEPRAVRIGWRQKLYTYPTQLQAAIYTQDPDEGENKSADGILVTTKDNANTTFDVIVMYRVKKEDVPAVFAQFGPIPIEDIQTQHIRRAVKEAINVVSTRYEVFELMGSKRGEASQGATEELRKRIGPKGITVEQVMLGSCYPSADLQSKINARVNSYTELEISTLRNTKAEIDRQSAIVKAESEAHARALSAAQTQQRSIDMLKLQAAEEAIQKWNGELPMYESKPGQTIVIGRDVLQAQGGRQ